jgi:hypothetical protein
LTGEYFDNGDFTGFAGRRVDASVAFDWGDGAPTPALEADTFSVRWSGQVEARYSEAYRFLTTSDDGIRLWVNNQLVIDHWSVHAPSEDVSVPVTLVAGQRYDIRIEYFENGGGATARLEWQSPSQARQIVPTTQLYTAP